MRTTAILNLKGGVAKTVTCVNMAAILAADYRKRVLVVDADSQANTTEFFGGLVACSCTMADLLRQNDVNPVVRPTSFPGVFLLGADDSLMDLDLSAVKSKTADVASLNDLLTGHMGDFDYVLIDCPPALSLCTYNAMAVASGLLIPVQMEGLSVTGLAAIVQEMKLVKRELNPSLEIRGMLPVMVDLRPNIVRSFVAYLEQKFSDCITKSIIPRSVRINEAQTVKQDIYEYKQWSPAATAYSQLCAELFS